MTSKKFENQPKGTEEMIPINKIIIPDEFLLHKNKTKKSRMEQRRLYYRLYGRLEKPITIQMKMDRKGKFTIMELSDGYSRYVLAKERCLNLVPVRYIN